MNKIRTSFLSIIALLFLCNSIHSQSLKTSIETDQVIDKYIKESLIINKKYKLPDDLEIFKKVFIGISTCDPVSYYKFRKNGTFMVVYYNDIEDINNLKDQRKEEGKWYIKGNKLFLVIKNKIVTASKIKYFQLKYYKRLPRKYTFKIIFDQDLYKGWDILRKEFN